MRVTIDLDNPTSLQILKAYYNLRYATGSDVLIRTSSTRGVHLKCSIDGDFEDACNLREILGDDLSRLALDKSRYNTSRMNGCSVLWTRKNDGKSGKWDNNYDAVDRIVQLTHSFPDDGYRFLRDK